MCKILYPRPSMGEHLPPDEQQSFCDLLELLRDKSGKRRFTIQSPSQSTTPFNLCPTVNIFFDTGKYRTYPYGVSKIFIKEADKRENMVVWPVDLGGTQETT